MPVKSVCTLLGFLFFTVQISDAQKKAVVQGYVINANTSTPLVGANISLDSSTIGTATNEEGFFELNNLPSGKHSLVVSYIGFQESQREVTLEKDQNLHLEIKLNPKELYLDELIVNTEMHRPQVTSAQVTMDLIKKIPSAFQTDVFRSLQLMPGIKSSSDFSSGLHIRGGSTDQTLIQLDRATVYNPSHFFGFFSAFNPDAVGDITLYKGGSPVKYGGRIGSVLSIKHKEADYSEFQGNLTLGLLVSGAHVAFPLSNGSWQVSTRRSTLEPLLNKIGETNDDIPDRFYFWDINSDITYKPNDDNKLSFSVYSGYDNLDFPYSEDASINLNYGNQIFSSSWTLSSYEKLLAELSITGSHYFNQPVFTVAQTPLERSNTIYDLTLYADFDYILNERSKLSWGFNAGWINLELSDRFNGRETFNSTITTSYGAWYLQHEWKLLDWLTIIPGLRLSTFDYGTPLRIAPRFSAEFQLSDAIQFQTHAGRYYQFLSLSSNETFSGFDIWLSSGDNVPPAYGDQFIAGINAQPSKRYQFGAEVYYRTMHDLFEHDPFVPDQTGLPYHDILRFGEGFAYGSEIQLKKNVGELTGFAGYTYNITLRRFPHHNAPVLQEGARYYPPKYHRAHEISVLLDYTISPGWSTTGTFTYSSGQPYTKPSAKTRAFDFPLTSAYVNQLVVENVNGSRLPPYHRLDLGVTRRGNFFGLGEMEFQLQAINVYSRRNVWFYDYELNDGSANYNEVTLLPLLPTLSLSLML